MLTSALCCWPMPKLLSFSAVGLVVPDVAKPGLLMTEALLEG